MLIIDQSSIKMTFSAPSAAAGVHVGTEHALLHCTKNANLIAGDTTPPDSVNNGDAIIIEGRVFLKSTANESDVGSLEFGIAQVSFVHSYEFLYVGRLESEGSTLINIRSGYNQNPSLDEEARLGRTIDQEIFRATARKVTRVGGANPGLDVTVKFGDHPNNAIPLQFQNRNTGAPNFLAGVSRNEEFVTYFLARALNVEPFTILARIGWSINWNAEFNWSASTLKPQKDVKISLLFPGTALIGAPDAADPFAAVVLSRKLPTTNDQDTAAQDAAWNRRLQPICVQKKERPQNFRANFFT